MKHLREVIARCDSNHRHGNLGCGLLSEIKKMTRLSG
jgi:hypothetical protein